MLERGNSLARRDAAAILHPNTNAIANERDGSLVVARGEGVYIYDDAGKSYIEAMGGLWCVGLGFGVERLAEAAARQIRTLSFYHAFSQKTHEPQIALAERLLALAPVPMARVFFASSGSEANDTAIKLIWYYNNAIGRPEKKKIIGRVRGYHGVTVAAASVTGVPNNHLAFDLPIAGFHHTDCPHFYRFAEAGESEEAFATRMADRLDALIRAEGPDTVAAFFAEPIMGAGGVILPPATYFEKIQAVLRRHDVLFVVDEVITGFGRTGHYWASQTFDLRPDILTCAKALSSGYQPISAVLMSEAIYRGIARRSDEIGVFAHGYTYGGHPVPAAVALETLKIYDEIDIVGHVRKVAPALQAGIRSFAGHPFAGEVAGLGLLSVLELVADPATRRPFDPRKRIGAAVVAAGERHGLIIRALGDRIGFSPPLVISEAEIAEMYDRFGRALDDVTPLMREAAAS